jgi:hypothetical protein
LKAARETTVSKAPAQRGWPMRASTRSRTIATSVRPRMRTIWERKEVFFREDSTRVRRSRGKAMRRGRPGNPPPVPRSGRRGQGVKEMTDRDFPGGRLRHQIDPPVPEEEFPMIAGKEVKLDLSQPHPEGSRPRGEGMAP